MVHAYGLVAFFLIVFFREGIQEEGERRFGLLIRKPKRADLADNHLTAAFLAHGVGAPSRRGRSGPLAAPARIQGHPHRSP